MDKIFIHGLSVDAVIGVHDWERMSPQQLIIDIELGTNTALSAHSDDIKKTIDYHCVAQRVMAFVNETSFELLEALAEKMASLILMEYAVKTVKIRISKPAAIAEAVCAGVEIERTGSDSLINSD